MIVLSKFGTAVEFPSEDESPNAYISRRLHGIRYSIDGFGFTTVDSGGDEIITEQRGVFRVNCLDW